MLANPAIPSISSTLADPDNPSETASAFNDALDSQLSSKSWRAGSKFPHTRAQLSLIAREFKPVDSSASESDQDNDDAAEAAKVSPALVKQAVALLDEENEDGLKNLLKEAFIGMDDDALEQHVLDLMHRHRDDIAGVPFLFLTPTKRPISRPSSRASQHSTHSLRLGPNRPETPSSAPTSPSLLGPGPIRRPHTPAMSPLASTHTASSYMSVSATSSPTIAQTFLVNSQYTTSLPASPLSSPRLLNAKAHEFRPAPRPLSAASSNPPSLSSLRTETPSPDLWSHGSPRGGSRLAIASPLIPDRSLTPSLPRAITPNSSLRASFASGDDEEDDPYDPFNANKSLPRSFHSVSTGASAADFDSSNSGSSLSEDAPVAQPNPWAYNPYEYDAYGMADNMQGLGLGYVDEEEMHHQENVDPEAAAVLTDGMTPFDVLSSVFGTTLAPSELEEALAANAYDFERAMQWLIERALPSSQPVAQGRGQAIGGGVHVVPRSQAGTLRGGRGVFASQGAAGRGSARYPSGRPAQGGNRVCRYFLAGECMRADCRFSHDLDRALCRFWLRGTCAKQDHCEFLHHLPNEVDVNGLNAAMGRMDMHKGLADGSLNDHGVPQDEFPTLSHDANAANRRGGYGSHGYSRDRNNYDPSRSRFAAAVKRSAAGPGPAVHHMRPNLNASNGQAPARREAISALGSDSVYYRPTVVAPRPSPRLKLRPPSLLPTLSTGESVSQLYMNYRARALRLGAARNACLSRAADAWRRGDGAAAKRFSREGHELNAKMATEAKESANRLVRERTKMAEQAVRVRDASWSSDPGDRNERGKAVGNGLGVSLGIASKDAVIDTASNTPEERTEVMIDLHGLHANEAAEVLEEFLLSLEKEQFFGLAYVVVGEEKHTGMQDPGRGASRLRLATGIREWLHNWGYPWLERDGVVCVDPLTHLQ